MSKAATTFFRLGCVLLVLTGLAHLLGHQQLMRFDPADENGKRMMELLKTYTDPEGGPGRTFWEFFAGFSLHFSVSVIGLGVVGGMLSLSRVTTGIAGMLAAVCIAMALNSHAYFFIVPTACLAVAAGAFVVAAALAWWSGAGTGYDVSAVAGVDVGADLQS